MNLRVDLILETEKRSGSFVSNKGMLRIVSVIVPVVLLGFLASQYLVVSQLNQDLQGIQQSYDSAKPQQQKAKSLMAEFQTHRNVAAELAGWRDSRIAWPQQFSGLIAIVPTNVQLSELAVNQTLQLSSNDTPARLFALTLKGRAVSDDAEQSVKRLEDALLSHPVFTGLTASVSVPLYGADTTPDAHRDDRIFQITCQYIERAFR